ncbi:MAG: radical SAM protein [Thermodesulfobacteriota bacterium]
MRETLQNNRLVRLLLRAAYRVSDSWLSATRAGELLRSNFTARAEIEFTSRCNLRCVYCYSVAGRHTGTDLDLNHLSHVVRVLKQRGILAVGVSGGGETTVVKGWHHHCNRLLDQGIDLFITTNLARELTDEEALTLARLMIIQVSVDTADPQLFKKLRRGGDLKTVVYNLAKIRSQALRHGLKGPVFWWNAVVSDLTVWGLREYVDFGLAQGIKHFNFLSMYEHQPVEGTLPVRSLSQLPVSELEAVGPFLEGVFHSIRRGKGSFLCNTLLEEVNRALALKRVGEFPPGERSYDRGPERLTRDCLDPWIYVKVDSNGRISPCCASGVMIGDLSSGDELSDILNNDAVRGFREGILTGNLAKVCRECKLKGWTTIDAMRLKVSLVSSVSRMAKTLHRCGLLIPLIHAWRR